MPDTLNRLAAMRSLLFVPGDQPDRFEKAFASGADGVILDLEDAVATDAKAGARAHIRAFLDQGTARIILRVNQAGSAGHAEDLALGAHDGVLAIMLPKAESVSVIAGAHSTGKPVLPIIESAHGFAALDAIASAPGAARLVLGTVDLALDLGLAAGTEGGQRMLDAARFSMLIASRMAQIAAPIDGVFTKIDDPDGLACAAAHACGAGFGGMLCIHPRQVGPVNTGFSASPREIAWAHKVFGAAIGQAGAFALDGEMIDAPVLARATRILRQAGQTP